MSRLAVREAIAEASAQLARAGVPSPRHDAEALAAYVLGVSRGSLAFLDADALAGAAGQYRSVVARRAAREPLQHVVGTAPFRHLELAVGPGVLIPRPETELLVDAVLHWLHTEQLRRPRIVDLGTGTGAIALALAHEYPGARVWAVEREPAGWEFARRNIAATGLPVALIKGDMADALPALDDRVDVVVSNPPYLPLELYAELEPEVRDYDPPAALFAGSDALAAVRAVASAGRRLLRTGGLAVVEHGSDQAASAPACFGPGWQAVTDHTDHTDHTDLSGRPRYLTAVRT